MAYSGICSRAKPCRRRTTIGRNASEVSTRYTLYARFRFRRATPISLCRTRIKSSHCASQSVGRRTPVIGHPRHSLDPVGRLGQIRYTAHRPCVESRPTYAYGLWQQHVDASAHATRRCRRHCILFRHPRHRRCHHGRTAATRRPRIHASFFTYARHRWTSICQ